MFNSFRKESVGSTDILLAEFNIPLAAVFAFANFSAQIISCIVTAVPEAISLLKLSSEENWYLYYSRGMSYERASKWSLAEKDFLYALELSPDQPLTLNYLGYSWIDYGKNLSEAKKLIRKAVQLRPNDGYFIDLSLIHI